MVKRWKGAVAALTLAATLAGTSTASAQYWYTSSYYYEYPSYFTGYSYPASYYTYDYYYYPSYGYYYPASYYSYGYDSSFLGGALLGLGLGYALFD